RILGEVAAVALAVKARFAVGPGGFGVHREVRAAHDPIARFERADAEGRQQARKAHAVRLARARRARLDLGAVSCAGGARRQSVLDLSDFSSAPSSRPVLDSLWADPRHLA